MRSQFVEIEFIPDRARNCDLREMLGSQQMTACLVDYLNQVNNNFSNPAQAIIVRIVSKEDVLSSKFNAQFDEWQGNSNGSVGAD